MFTVRTENRINQDKGQTLMTNEERLQLTARLDVHEQFLAMLAANVYALRGNGIEEVRSLHAVLEQLLLDEASPALDPAMSMHVAALRSEWFERVTAKTLVAISRIE
jgi:ABC-type iron transport system FetAB ATPase subunit